MQGAPAEQRMSACAEHNHEVLAVDFGDCDYKLTLGRLNENNIIYDRAEL